MATSAARAKETTANIHEYVGQQIQKLRKEKKLSPASFAGLCGMSPVALSKLENGGAACLARLQIIAERNDVNVEYFFDEAVIPDDYPDH